ncbi:ArsR family transcriptional regulator [Candidatus Bathyarchaeota archaeon]|nr:MAG: ArsR family transcriptional regulator [Candidatus Bathyarchaeota archaeon]
MGDPSLLGPMRAQILALLLAQPRTAKDAAERLKIQVSAARKHLERLGELGLVDEQFQKAEMGRPKKIYTLREKGKEIFPRQYDMLLNETLAQLAKDKGVEYPESVMNKIADNVVQREGSEQATRGEKAEKLLKLLDGLGFQASLKKSQDNYVFTSSNCPLLKTAEAHQEIVCRGFHEQFIKKYLNTAHLKRETWIIDGDPYCTHTIPKP